MLLLGSDCLRSLGGSFVPMKAFDLIHDWLYGSIQLLFDSAIINMAAGYISPLCDCREAMCSLRNQAMSMTKSISCICKGVND